MRRKILISNDDGILAVGINVLAEVFGKDNDVIVVAPNKERSACSHSLSIHSNIEYRKEPFRGGITAYSTSGTPADCVKLGILHLLEEKPDLVITGINNGSNLGSDIMYSGTVSAAFEAAYLGVKAIAVSLEKWDCAEALYLNAANFLHDNLEKILKVELPIETVLNVNYPVANVIGAKFCSVGVNLYDDTFVLHPELVNTVQLKGRPITHDKNKNECDVELIKKGYITISPIHLDRNDYNSLELLKNNISFKI